MSQEGLPTVHPLAAQMAQLLTGSDTEELREVVRRWIDSAESEAQRSIYQRMGQKLLELKQAFTAQGMKPTRGELEVALTVMFGVAGEGNLGGPGR